ncbi:hypothetical protein M5K25_023167 [Dendrobium thyrsiflorum]|uniref:Uncharacterized protein n=1 Tax=Dendrobium thyrsiflorum TaxID=117978 RepID=A0ABD0UE56_DENTH
MASCINTLKDRPAMYGTPLPASPRISFSNDLAAEARPPRRDIITPDPNFEFAVGVRPMIAADELFFKGRMLPLSSGQLARVTTVREELRAEGAPQPKGLVRWKEFLGLKRLNSGHPAPRNGKSVNSSATPDAAGELRRKIQSGSEKTIVL